jgi:hypothetical protein
MGLLPASSFVNVNGDHISRIETKIRSASFKFITNSCTWLKTFTVYILKNYSLKCLWYILKIKIKNPTCFGHSYSTIIRGSQCLSIYYYQCACNILYAYVAVCYLCVCTCGVLARVVSARVHKQTPHGQAHHMYRHTGNTQPHTCMRYCTHIGSSKMHRHCEPLMMVE